MKIIVVIGMLLLTLVLIGIKGSYSSTADSVRDESSSDNSDDSDGDYWDDDSDDDDSDYADAGDDVDYSDESTDDTSDDVDYSDDDSTDEVTTAASSSTVASSSSSVVYSSSSSAQTTHNPGRAGSKTGTRTYSYKPVPNTADSETVYVNSRIPSRYHKNPNCSGLQRYGGHIDDVGSGQAAGIRGLLCL